MACVLWVIGSSKGDLVWNNAGILYPQRYASAHDVRHANVDAECRAQKEKPYRVSPHLLWGFPQVMPQSLVCLHALVRATHCLHSNVHDDGMYG